MDMVRGLRHLHSQMQKRDLEELTMRLSTVIPLLLSVLLVLVLSLVAWGVVRLRRRAVGDTPWDAESGLLLGLLLLGVFALGVFLTYVLLGLGA
jgi:hypothetical protein